MRHLFDQYNQPENRLTHALVSSLANDPALLKKFIQWVTGQEPPLSQLFVVEQTLPGQEEPVQEDETRRRGLPDGWIYGEENWCLLIESKIQSPLRRDQLDRHRVTALKRGFEQILLLALVPNPSEEVDLGNSVILRKWTDLYLWMSQQTESEWAGRLTSYMQVLEQKLVLQNYLREGTLTVFDGIRFGKDNPYSYIEAKRLLRLALDELRKRGDLQEQLRMDSVGEGRPAITGRESTRIWDFLRLEQARGIKNFTEFPHLTLSIHDDQLIAAVTVPNGIRREFRRNLLAGGHDQFYPLFEALLGNLTKALKGIAGAVPWVEVLQRRYPSQRSEPIIDAKLQFDLRTAFHGDQSASENLVKHQEQWLGATYEALSKRNSNLQVAVGAVFPFDRCPDVRKPEILNHVANVWLACKPLIDLVVEHGKASA
ncbi:MAG TPA: hypothetical protein VMT28_11275 [Terriglobales bacterium]|jgi:hypothetical protein|nr:hypothetical protein [Terriglobales bacterium]